jgi:DNA repair protein RadC
MNQPTLSFFADVPTQPNRQHVHQAPRPLTHYTTREYGVVTLRECTIPYGASVLDHPEALAGYAKQHLTTSPFWRARVENFAVVMLNTRRRLIGHQVISNGTLDSLLVHAREVFYPAIEVAAHAIALIHNHPSGDPSPSEADVRITRDLIRAGQILKIDVLDHVILGKPSPGYARDYVSLRELGHFYLS